jgi:hypothetical protein
MKAHWRKASLIALAVSVFATLAPNLAHAAAPTITSVTPYGNARPGDWSSAACGTDAACLAKGPSSLFANSQPRAKYQKGLLWITGNATPGVYIDVTVSDATAPDPADATKTIPAGRQVRETYSTATTAVPDFNIAVGDFLESGDVPSINVTDLGNHWAGAMVETAAGSGIFVRACSLGAATAGCDRTSQTPANWGPSTLYVFVKARNTAGETSPYFSPVPTITKYAGTPVPAGEAGDNVAPAFTRGPTWPPKHWCHLSSKGPGIPSPINQNLGGDYDGRCGALSNDSIGALPDITWLIFGCYPPDQFPNPWPVDWRKNACRDKENSRMPAGEISLTGQLTDDPSSAFGTASEVGDAQMRVDQGTVTVLGPYNGVVRNGPQAGYGQKVRINDLAPNWSPGTTIPYTAKVTIWDAWGNPVSAQSSFTVYPW